MLATVQVLVRDRHFISRTAYNLSRQDSKGTDKGNTTSSFIAGEPKSVKLFAQKHKENRWQSW